MTYIMLTFYTSYTGQNIILYNTGNHYHTTIQDVPKSIFITIFLVDIVSKLPSVVINSYVRLYYSYVKSFKS